MTLTAAPGTCPAVSSRRPSIRWTRCAGSLLEEIGLEVDPLDFVGAWLDRYGDGPDAPTTLNLYWTARVTGGEPVAGDDAAELRWFPHDALPADGEIGFQNVRDVLRAWRGEAG